MQLALQRFNAQHMQLAETLFFVSDVAGVVAHHDASPDKMPSQPPRTTLQPIMARHVKMQAGDTAQLITQAHWRGQQQEEKESQPSGHVTMFAGSVVLLVVAIGFGCLVAADIRRRSK